MRVVVLAIVGTACGPEIKIEPLQPVELSSDVFFDDFATDVLAHRPTLVDADVFTAGSAELLPDDGSYRRMRLRLWSHRPKRALDGVPEDLGGSLFPDRIALSRGEAFERLGDDESAKAAYFEAIRTGRANAVVEDGARGVVRVLGRLGDHERRLVYLDALIKNAPEDEPADDLEIERAVSHAMLGRTDEAMSTLVALIDRFPDPIVVKRAEAELLAIEKRRRPTPARTRATEIARLKWYTENASPYRAARMIRRAPRSVQLDPTIVLVTADLAAKRNRRWEAQSILTSLSRRDPSMRAATRLRMARLSRDRYRWDRSREAYREVIETYGSTEEATQAAFESAEMEFEADDYVMAAAQARRFVRLYPDAVLLGEAEWLAGFSAVLADDFEAARRTFEAALAREERPRMRYWLGRCFEQTGDTKRAIAAYAAVARADPLTYDAHLARKRLGALGVPAFFDSLPSVPAPQSVAEAIELLGPNRPEGIDRAAALFAGNLRREGTEELLSLAAHFRATGNTLGVTLVVDLFQLFDKDAWVFLLSRRLTESADADALERRPYYWRVWRYAFPRPFLPEVTTASAEHDVDPLLVFSVMRTESLFRPDAVSPVGARGLMQLMPQTARWIGRRDRRAKRHARSYRRPASNIWLGTWNLRYLLNRYDEDIVRALAAYNAGPGAVDRWAKRFPTLEPDEFVERIPYDETRRYVRRAVESHAVYQLLH